MQITATVRAPDGAAIDYVPQVGDRVSVVRRTQVGHTGTMQDWHICPADTQLPEGPLAPAWGDHAGYSTQSHGWGLGTVVDELAEDHGVATFAVELDSSSTTG